MPNTVLEMSPLARSSHSINIDDLPSLPADSDKNNSPLASRLTRVKTARKSYLWTLLLNPTLRLSLHIGRGDF